MLTEAKSPFDDEIEDDQPPGYADYHGPTIRDDI